MDQSLSTETNQSIVSQEQNVRFEDTAKVIEQRSNLPLEARWSSVNPYPEDTPSTLLGRVVQLPDYAWNGAWTGTEIKLLTAFLTVSNIHQAVLGSFSETMYRFLQCGYKVVIRVNSTPFHQGALCVTWCPDNYQTAAVPGGILGYGSMQNAVILSASQQDQVTLDIPYFQLNPHYDLAFPGDWIDTRVNIKVLNPLITSNSAVTDTVPVSVFIQMTNIHTYGILDPDALRARPLGVTKTNFFKQSSKARVNKEAETKDALGESAKGVASLVSPILRQIPLIGGILDFGKNIFANLDKPQTDQVTTFVTDRPHKGHTHLTGTDLSETLSSFPNAEVTMDRGMISSNMNVVDYCQIPALFYSTTITTKGVVLKIAVHPAVYTSTYRPVDYPDYLAFATGFYRFYRGSMRYLFQFVGTPFYSCRFKISVVHSLGAPPGGTGNGTGFMSRVIDVKGDAWTSFVVPYLGRRMWSYTTTTADSIANTPWLIVEAVTDVQGSSLPAEAVYYMNVWRAAGPDYQLAMQTSWQGTLTPSTAITKTNFVKQSALAQKWAEPTEGLKEGSVGLRESGTYMADQATTINDMFKRFTPHSSPVGGPYSFPSDWDTTNVEIYPIKLFSGSFLFWSGGRRIKTAPYNSYYAATHVTQTPHDFGNAIVPNQTANIAGSTITPFVQVPWYCTELAYTTRIARYDYLPTNPTFPVDLATTSVSGDVWIAGSDDFSYYWLVPPNPNAVQPVSPLPQLKAVISDPKANGSSNSNQVERNACNARFCEQIT